VTHTISPVTEPSLVTTLERELASFLGLQMTRQKRLEVRVRLARLAPGTPVLWVEHRSYLHVGIVDAALYKEVTGVAPKHDDLERANCTKQGPFGHQLCGICEEHERPRSHCGCIARAVSTLDVRRR
jgi:hypothetical protein